MSNRLLNPRMHVAELSREYTRNGLVVVNDVLDADFARELLDGVRELDALNLWYQSTLGDAAFVDETRDVLTLEGRECHYAFRFEKYPLHNVSVGDIVSAGHFGSRRDIRSGLDDNGRGRLERIAADPLSELPESNPLRSLRSLLQSGEMAALLSELLATVVPAAAGVFFLSRFRSGDFLAPHDDGVDPGHRLCAAVLGLTPFWLPHWGGNLIMYGEDLRNPPELFVPRFNSLILFNVPRLHAVSAVSASCPRARYSVSGWIYRSADKLGKHLGRTS